ncbi:hypothetical protein NHX12_006781 [Muraenolepis orangiensis]|uniref:PDZ domain-containing protein n=1 Tax=Muraenolepis orangiensis TaxID=630683 RepID=A0A9Q0DLQ0_9TELE|nr:hypothetical protein NHX12_006781 [Muraenolepis orangiensis]
MYVIGHVVVLQGSSLVVESSGALERSPSKHSFDSRPIPPQTIPPQTIPPQTIPPQTIPPQTIPPQTIPPQTIPPQTIPPQTIPPQTIPPQTIPPQTIPPQTITPQTIPPQTIPPQTHPSSDHPSSDHPSSDPAQEVFRKAMRSPLVLVEVVPSTHRERYEKHLIGQLFGGPPAPDASPSAARSKDPPPPVKTKPAFKPARHPAEEAAAPQPAAASKGRSQSPLLRKSPALGNLVANKKGGKRLKIDLKKGVEGLGFTVVTRDSSVHGPGPILVKNILPRGAALKDGRLQSGDRILEVTKRYFSVNTLGVTDLNQHAAS